MVNKSVVFDTRIYQNLIARLSLKPATLAVLIQVLALLSVLLISWAVHWFAAIIFNDQVNFPVSVLVLLQAIIAACYAYWAGMAKWWRWIHLCFPVAVWVMSSLQIPSTFYLAGFIITLSLYWTTYRTQVPFFPSRPVIWQQVAAVIPQDKPIRLIDIGSGLGDMSMHLAKVRPDCVIEGIEIAPLPWVISFLRAKLKRSAAVFMMGDYRELDFADYDVIFAYLSPAAMPALWQKAKNEMRSGSLLMSYEFEIEGVSPTEAISSDGRAEKLYVWKLS